jgi:ABC-type branched-subunit amino acid transport system ATPase component
LNEEETGDAIDAGLAAKAEAGDQRAFAELMARHKAWLYRFVRRHQPDAEEAYDILTRLKLGDVAYQTTRELPYGRQRLLEIALALATKPKVLLLDEPAAGVPQEESGDIFEVVASLSNDLTLLFIEHDMHVVFRFATHIIVLVGGAVFTEGSPAEIAADPGVREVYLGKRHHG